MWGGEIEPFSIRNCARRCWYDTWRYFGGENAADKYWSYCKWILSQSDIQIIITNKCQTKRKREINSTSLSLSFARNKNNQYENAWFVGVMFGAHSQLCYCIRLFSVSNVTFSFYVRLISCTLLGYKNDGSSIKCAYNQHKKCRISWMWFGEMICCSSTQINHNVS